MSNAGFPVGFLLVCFAAWCIFLISETRDPAKVRAYGLGLLGCFVAFSALLIAVALS